MRTEEVYVKNDGTGLEFALRVTDSFVKTQGLTGRNAMHMRLITEEMIGMVSAIAGEFKSLFWIEGDDKECTYHLTADLEIDQEKRKEFLSASTSGKNESARGIMGKIRELIEIGMENYEDVSKLQMQYGIDPVSYGMMGMDNDMMSQAAVQWSLQKYRDSVSDSIDEGEGYKEAWDELEKSVIANITDDVRVGIMNDRLVLTILKKFGS
ncbi:MAG: hypothetical protein IJ075_03815 [Lachnospiraceae bacterium]|nr:hypothetical protein [Lachnospiraceae bacterium]MBQ9606844.1 hypothetical protein [Lachnospiraceae bacterium]MBR1523423.1 hypothetical protein [Lachnospiraceae bacterium]